jgi:Domain of unknown function (DUF4349)
MSAPDPFPPAVAEEIAQLPPELAELAVAVRADRPTLDSNRARRLDARVARAFAAERVPRRSLRLPSALLAPALGLAVCALVALLAVLGGSGGDGGGSGASTAGGGSSGGAARSAPAPSSGAAGGVELAPSTGSRAVERTTTLRIATARRDVDAAASAAAQVATSLGGYVAASTITSERIATLQLAVPGDRLDAAIARLSRLGHVRQLERSTLDITDQATSARARVDRLRAERHGLLRRLAQAPSARAADRIRAQLAGVTRRLARARAAARELRTRASYASVALTIRGERHPDGGAGGGRWTPGDALRDAGRVLEVALGVAIVALAVVVPLLAFGAVGAAVSRRLNRRRLERALDAV